MGRLGLKVKDNRYISKNYAGGMGIAWKNWNDSYMPLLGTKKTLALRIF